jgi:hypothetical protein
MNTMVGKSDPSAAVISDPQTKGAPIISFCRCETEVEV